MAASSGNNFQGSISFDVSQAITELQKLQDKYTQLQTAIANKSYSPAVLNSLELELARVNTQIQTLQTNVNSAGKSLENNLTAPSYNSFRAIGSLDRVTREFASGGLQQGANGLVMFGNSLSRMAMMEGSLSGAFKSMGAALTGPAGIVLGFSLLVGIFESYSKVIKEAKDEQDKFAKSLDDARKSAIEQADNLNILLKIASSATASDNQRQKALEAVKKELGGVNSQYAAQIKNVDDAKKAVIEYTKALIQQAIVQRYQKEIADKSIELADTEFNIQKARANFLKTQNSLEQPTGIGSSMDIKSAQNVDKLTFASKELRDENTKRVILTNELFNATTKLNSAVEVGVNMPLFTDLMIKTIPKGSTHVEHLTDTFKGLGKELNLELAYLKRIRDELDKLAKPVLTYGDKENTKFRKQDLKLEEARVMNPEENSLGKYLKGITENLAPAIAAEKLLFKEQSEGWKKSKQLAYEFADAMSGDITNSIGNVWSALQKGDNVFKTLSDEVSRFAENLALAIIKAEILAAIQGAITVGSSGAAGAAAGGTGFWDMLVGLLGAGQKHAAGGIVSSPQIGMIGEAGPEAIMPLDKLKGFLNTSFSAGAMSGQSSGGNGQFVLKGQDLILAINRSNASLNLRRGF